MKIYWFKAQAPHRVLALAKHLCINVELEEVDMMKGGLRSPTYKSLNPNMKAPTLIDGDQVIWESEAIMAYLCAKADSDMWPSNPWEQVEVMRWMSWNNCHWAPAVGAYYFEHVVRPTFGLGTPDREAQEKKRGDLLKFTPVLNAHLANNTYVACGRLTIADFHLAAMATHWRKSEMPIGDFQNVVRWLTDLDRLPAWSNPWPPSKYALTT